MKKITRLEEVVAFANEYGTLYNDIVEGPKGHLGRYLRWKWSGAGVVVVPVHEDKIALGWMYRYSPGIESLEFPGGGIDDGEDLLVAANRELREEFGLIASDIKIIGSIYPDTGLMERSLNVAVAFISDVSMALPQNLHEDFEAISDEIVWMDISQLKIAVKNGRIRAGTTMAAALLYLSYLT
jgi:8-oxo-dGTP pyrophosphatase MutT (NUDIX family)